MSRKRSYTIHLHDEEMAERIAHIAGPLSAHAKALAQLKERRAAGEDVYLWLTEDKTLLVGPEPASGDRTAPA